MGFMDKAKDLASGNKDKTNEGLDKAGDFADEKTGGKHTEHIDGGVDQARGALGIEEEQGGQGGQGEGGGERQGGQGEGGGGQQDGQGGQGEGRGN